MTHEEIEAARTVNGGWTRAQLAAWGVSWPPPKGWKVALAPRSKPNGRDRETGLGAKHESGNQRPNIGNNPTKPVE